MKKTLSEEHKRKIGESLKGKKYHRTCPSPNKGKKSNPESVKKMIETKKKLFSEGKLKIWNKGMDKKEYLDHYKNGMSGLFKSEEMKGKNHPLFGKEHSLETKKKISCTKRNIEEKDFKGFSTFDTKDYVRFTRRIKREVRKRDNQVCMLCGIHREKLNKALCVHHLNYDKGLSIPQNLVALCPSCHTKTNHNRKHWITFFQSILSEIYNYQYSEDQEPILNITLTNKI